MTLFSSTSSPSLLPCPINFGSLPHRSKESNAKGKERKDGGNIIWVRSFSLWFKYVVAVGERVAGKRQPLLAPGDENFKTVLLNGPVEVGVDKALF